MELCLMKTVQRAATIRGREPATQMGDRLRNWSEFRARTARLAAGLASLGVSEGDRVAMLALNSDRYLEWFFAVPWAGGVFVPVNTRLAAPEIAYWLNDSGSTVLFIDDDFLPMLERLRQNCPQLATVIYVGDGDAPSGLRHFEALIETSSEMAPADRKGEDLAGIFYTGGTTGVSKGVMLSHRNLLMNALFVVPALGFSDQTNWLHGAPMFHMADGTASFGVTMAAGSHSFIPKFEVEAALAAIARHRVTASVFVPTMVNMIVNHPAVDDYDLSTLKTVLYGASPMPAAVLRRALEVLPQVCFTHGYGQTESGPFLSCLPPRFHDPEGPQADKMASIGFPHMGAEIRILDADDHEVERGTVGEICARAPNVMLGYWNKPELTAETLRNGWLHTGDGGYMDEDGFLYIVDRVKDMIISGGENVYSAEVENALYKHPAVLECAVIGVPDDKWGERVHAIVRLKPDSSVNAEGLIGHCHELIAGYKCPRSLEFRDDPLPLSGAGKILKSELRKPYWEGQAKQVH